MIRYRSFHDLLANQDAASIALEYFEGDEKKSLSYGELLRQIEAFPLPQEDVIGIFGDPNVDAIVAFFALAGKKRIVMLSGDDPTDVLTEQIKATHVQKLIGPDDLLEELGPHLVSLAPKEDPDILFFTSGTTGRSKAVVLTEESLCSSAYNGGSLLPLKKSDSLLAILPLSHVFGLVCALLWPLSFGAKVCLGRGIRSVFFDFGAYRPTVATLVPQIAGFLVQKRLLNPELRLVLIGAGDCSDGVLNAIKALGIRVSFGYGLSETSSGVALSLGDDPRAMTVCPDYHLEIAGDGEILLSGSPTFMKGYYHDEKATNAALRGGVLYTGDLGTYKDGVLTLTGRKKEILVFNDGSKLFLPEYEEALARRLGPECDFAIIQDDNGKVVLEIYKPLHVEHVVEQFNQSYSWSHHIARIHYRDEPLPRTKTGKVQRYLLKQ